MFKTKIISKNILVVTLSTLILMSCSSCDSPANNEAGNVNSPEVITSVPDVSSSPQVSQGTEKVESSSQLTLEIKSGNSWENGGKKYNQMDVIINNNNQSEASDWSVEIPVSPNTAVDQIWNATYSLNNDKLVIKGEQYNNKITGNSNVSFGCILIDSGNIDPKLAKLDYKINNTVATTTGNGSDTGNQKDTTNQNNDDNKNSNDTNNAKDQNLNQNNQPTNLSIDGVPPPSTDDWLHTSGNKILDSKGKEVWLTGVNWFGYNTGTNVFDGLWGADLNASLSSIADRGFNILRIPISSELILKWASGNPPKANFNEATNSYLVGMNSLEIFDYVVLQCRANGIKIMIDIHSAQSDPMGHMKPVWYEGDITEKDYLDSLSFIAERYKSDDTIIAYDLKNEPHGKPDESPRAIWNDSKDPNNWKYIAQKAANAVLSKNPNALILVEGIEIYPIDIKKNSSYSSKNKADYYFNWWGGNLRGVKDYPINLGKNQDQLVYSPHDYGPSVYEQPWFKGGYTYDSLYKDCWKDNWMFIHEKKIAPLLIGEWGGFMKEPNLTWMTHLRKLIKTHKLNHTFWCFNSNSGDTGGLVLGDFTTWDEEKYKFVKEVLWQKNGKFVGLDHKIPLGKNGITLSQY